VTKLLGQIKTVVVLLPRRVVTLIRYSSEFKQEIVTALELNAQNQSGGTEGRKS
jgi:hypothetical protein